MKPAMKPAMKRSLAITILAITILAAGLGATLNAQAQYNPLGYSPLGPLHPCNTGTICQPNPHQALHDAQNSAFFSISATAVSNSITPGFEQKPQGTIEQAMQLPGGSNAANILYWDVNPYAPGTTNHQLYQDILRDAKLANYTNTPSADGINYLTKPSTGSSVQLANLFAAYLPGTLVFQAAKDPGQDGMGGGGVAAQVSQSAEATAHLAALRGVSGSNLYMNFNTNVGGQQNSYLGAIALNQEYNHSASLNLDNYQGFDAAANQIQQQTAQTGNEHGFYLDHYGYQAEYWQPGTADGIHAAYNPNASLHAHSHPGGNGMPSITDMISAAQMGIPGAVIGPQGIMAYGFVQHGGKPGNPRAGFGFRDDEEKEPEDSKEKKHNEKFENFKESAGNSLDSIGGSRLTTGLAIVGGAAGIIGGGVVGALAGYGKAGPVGAKRLASWTLDPVEGLVR